MLSRKEFFNQIFKCYLEEKQGYIETREFVKGNGSPIRKFHKSIKRIAEYAPEGNYYFGVCPREKAGSGKKDNIRYVTTLWVDLDYGEIGHKKKTRFQTQEEALDEIQGFEVPSSIIVDSGRGLHVYWLLKKPVEIEDPAHVESVIKGITQHLGGDVGTQDITRILRVPGSNNLKIPDKPRPCQVLLFNEDARYDFSEFKHYAATVSSFLNLPDVSFPDDLPKVDLRKLKVDAHIKKLIKEGDAEGRYSSRSECDLAVINALVFADCDEVTIKAIFSDPKKKISGKYLERAEGKQNADGYLAHQIKTARALKEQTDCINKFILEGKKKEAEIGISKLPEQYRELYQKKLKKSEDGNGAVVQSNNRYFKVIQGKSGEQYIPISNFVINIKHRFITAGDCTREIYFVNMKNERTKELILESQQMASLNRFKEFCLLKGNFIFEGSEKDLFDIWKLEFSKDQGKAIFQPDHVGYIDEHNLWLFENCAIKNGQIFDADDNGIIWIGDNGFKALPLNYKDVQDLPQVKILSDQEDVKLENYFIDKLKQNIGGFEAWLAIGCAKAWVYSNEIYKLFGFSPFLFIYGKTRSGKDTLAGWLLSLFGISRTAGESLPEMSSPVGISRKGGYYSSLGVWLDEYRNDKRIIRFNGFFRNLFNRTGASKGRKASFGTYNQRIRANFIFSGEQLPEDPALRNRCIPIRLSKIKRDDSLFNAINETSRNFSAIGLRWIREKTLGETKRLLTLLADFKKELTEKHGLESDLAEIYAVPLAAFFTIREDLDFFNWVVQEAKREKFEKRESDVINRFFDDIEGLHSKGIISAKHILKDYDHVYLWFTEMYRLWRDSYKGIGDTPFPKNAILDYLKEEDYWVEPAKGKDGNVKTQKKLNGTNRRCIVLDYNRIPESLKAVVDGRDGMFE